MKLSRGSLVTLHHKILKNFIISIHLGSITRRKSRRTMKYHIFLINGEIKTISLVHYTLEVIQ